LYYDNPEIGDLAESKSQILHSKYQHSSIPGTSGKSGLFHVPSTELQYQAEVQLPEVTGTSDKCTSTWSSGAFGRFMARAKMKSY
jgi:hypothetical protein